MDLLKAQQDALRSEGNAQLQPAVPANSHVGEIPPSSKLYTPTAAAQLEESKGKITSGASLPPWLINVPSTQDRYPALKEDAATDVCVIGAGIAGLTTAYELLLLGKSVIVIEDGDICSGETGRTTAHLMWEVDDHYSQLISMHGVTGARTAYESHRFAVERIREISEREQIDAEFRYIDGYLINGLPTYSKDYTEKPLEKEMAALKQLAIGDAVWVDAAPVPGIQTGRAIKFPKHADIHPIKYLKGLAEAIVRRGGHIFCNTHAQDISDDSQGCTVKTKDNVSIRCKALVEATNVPITNRISIIDKCMAYRSYVIAGYIPKGSVPPALVWDCADPYHYARTASDVNAQAPANSERELLIVGGEDHKVGFEDDALDHNARYQRLEQWTRERYPMLQEVVYRWSGQIIEPIDALAFIGKNPGSKNIYLCTADSGNGMTHGTIAGKLLADEICHRPNPWAKLYDPFRHTLSSLPRFLKHNLRVQMEYRRWLQRGDVQDIEEIPRCSGAVMVKNGFKHAAVYRDGEGQVHEMSAVCPHLYGIVTWNETEKSWDCPVHGSRFDCRGKVINGPAKSHLAGSDSQHAQ